MFSQDWLLDHASITPSYQRCQLTCKSYRLIRLLLDYRFLFASIGFFIFTADIIELDLVLFLVLENPVGATFFNAGLLYELEDVESVSLDNRGVKELLLLNLRHLFSFN
jgi:hypothetical protein